MACASCGRPAVVLVTLRSPRGEYQLCRQCLGRDGEPARLKTAVFPGPAARKPPAPTTPGLKL